MDTIDALSVDAERNDNQAQFENNFYNISTGRPILESAAGPRKPLTLEEGGNESRAIAGADPKNVAIFGSNTIVPVSWKPGRHGLARTLFEILSFRPLRMRTRVLVWSLTRKASYTFPIFR